MTNDYKKSNSDYTLQRMLPAEWESYRSIRLEALNTDPEVFGSSYEKEAGYDKQDWITLLQKDSRAIFALYHLNLLIGLSGVAIKKEEESTAILFSSFIKVPYRGIGLSKLFYQARIDWARQKRCTSIVVSHRIGNELSKAANQHFGFKYSHSQEVMWPDGKLADERVYLLKL
eukprot:gene21816-25891_t